MWAIKVGGSLSRGNRLQNWLTTIARHAQGQAILVPGGGSYADAVRAQQARWRFDDSSAHAMALLAMDQYGLQLIAQGNEATPGAFRPARARHELLAAGAIPVWLPSRWVDQEAAIARDWKVTSDSLALWLARALGLPRLLLIKSLHSLPTRVAAEEAAEQGWIDAAFPPLWRGAGVAVALLGEGEDARLPALLRDDFEAACRLV